VLRNFQQRSQPIESSNGNFLGGLRCATNERELQLSLTGIDVTDDDQTNVNFFFTHG
jgi:hypothetical protein